MRSRTLLFVFLVNPILISLAGCGDTNPTSAKLPEEEPLVPQRQPEKAWTFLFYDDAEFQGYDPIDDFRTRMKGGENLHVLILRDDEFGPAKTYSVSSGGGVTEVFRNGEVNMADGQTVKDFIAFGKEYYPADRYILSFYDHGGAWAGSCMDITSGNDFLTMGEKKAAFEAAGGVDVVLFSAPCNMGSFEAAYNLRDQTDLYIGSPNTSGYVFWRDTMADLSLVLRQNPAIGIDDLAATIIESVWEHKAEWMQDVWQDGLTMTAVKTEGLEGVANALDLVARRYLARGSAFESMVSAVSGSLTRYSSSLVDMGDLAALLLAEEDDPDTRIALESLIIALEGVIISECHGTSWPRGTSLNLFLPDSTTAGRLANYTSDYYGLDLVGDTEWDELLMALYGPTAVGQGWFKLTSASDWLPVEVPFRTDGFSPWMGLSCR